MLNYNRIASISRAICVPRNIRTPRPVLSSVGHICHFTVDAACFPTAETISTQFDNRANSHCSYIDTLGKDVESIVTHPNSAKKIVTKFKEQTSSPIEIYRAEVPIAKPDDSHFYWHRVPQWRDVTEEQFLSYDWTVNNTIKGRIDLFTFLNMNLPQSLAPSTDPRLQHIQTRDDFIQNAMEGLKQAPMAVRLTPQLLSVIDWNAPIDDPVRRQFIPLLSAFVADHPSLTVPRSWYRNESSSSLDSLHEEADSPVPGLVHRYPDKALFLATSICPVYCRYCTRSYAIGCNTDTVFKSPQRPSRRRWEVIFHHIEKTPVLNDIVVSGGDTYHLSPLNIVEIGNRLLEIPHIKRIRFATRGLAVAPGRILDPHDAWTSAIIEVSNRARDIGKHVCIHTHFNHPNEITWVTKEAARYLFKNNVIVRNQSVLLKGVNDNVETMGRLIRDLADMNYQPYYVYQGDLVKGVEDLRTPLSKILKIEQHLRGTIAGFMMPSFVVDLPGGGGKRLAASFDTYDEKTGVSTFKAPGLLGVKGQNIYEYYDPHRSNDNDSTIIELHAVQA